MQASVKVMRSYDYCHFEIAISTDEDQTIEEINEMRKAAAVLVDEAVRQYKIAKKAEDKRYLLETDKTRMIEKLNRIKQKPQSELTVEEAALLRYEADKDFWKQYEEDDYYYEDDPEIDHHFSMLQKFLDARISA